MKIFKKEIIIKNNKEMWGSGSTIPTADMANVHVAVSNDGVGNTYTDTLKKGPGSCSLRARRNRTRAQAQTAHTPCTRANGGRGRTAAQRAFLAGPRDAGWCWCVGQRRHRTGMDAGVLALARGCASPPFRRLSASLCRVG